MANVAIPTNAVDLDGLGDLRRRAQRDDPSALADVAVQFEALFIGMMLESARSASLGGGLFDGAETEQYLQLMDRQVALELARQGGFGFGKMLERQLTPREGPQQPAPSALRAHNGVLVPTPDSPVVTDVPTPVAPLVPGQSAAEFPRGLPATLAKLGGAEAIEAGREPTPAQFVSALRPHAEQAAAALGIEPRLLLAQAALETGWGKALPQRGAETTHNLFGIKAGASWSGAAAEHWTLEHADGVTAPQHERFRAYGSPAESVADYVDLISTARRYADALAQSDDPEAYARAVTKAGYATDPSYADKWLAIYHGDRLEHALQGIDLPQPVSKP